MINLPILDPMLKRLAQEAKFRHFNLCRNPFCRKKFRGRNKCPRCGSYRFREVHHDAKPKRRGK